MTFERFEGDFESIQDAFVSALIALWETIDNLDDRLLDDDCPDDAEDHGELRCRIGDAIFNFVQPRTIGDIQKLTDSLQLRMWLLPNLIERDAKEEYDQIDGYLDAVWSFGEDGDKIELLMLDPKAAEFDGMDVTVWMDANLSGDSKTVAA